MEDVTREAFILACRRIRTHAETVEGTHICAAYHYDQAGNLVGIASYQAPQANGQRVPDLPVATTYRLA